MKCAIFLNMSTTTKMNSFPLEEGNQVMNEVHRDFLPDFIRNMQGLQITW